MFNITYVFEDGGVAPNLRKNYHQLQIKKFT